MHELAADYPYDQLRVLVAADYPYDDIKLKAFTSAWKAACESTGDVTCGSHHVVVTTTTVEVIVPRFMERMEAF
ncbi:hypothetical protein IFM89_029383 [Coptis chinensis]|uniref:Uncharacterized protein n=1 Tax=Coptis chinensis TaxID=261450 RepID=A0A835IR86_9MAGN|nr:hypothetical protein IFM89_029383 [Coptis chinensis]